MQIENVLIETLNLDPSNARRHDEKNLAAIKGSLAKFGQQKPIVVGKNNVILAGNGTLQAAQALGWTEIKIVRTDLSGPEAMAYALSDNRTAELASWDDDILGKQLQALYEDGFEIEDIGFVLNDFDDSWDTDLNKDSIDGIESNLDGITAVIKITCPQEIKDQVSAFLKKHLSESNFAGIGFE